MPSSATWRKNIKIRYKNICVIVGNLEDGGETLPVGEEVWVVHQPGHQRLEGGHDGGVQVLAVRLHQSRLSIQDMDQSRLSIQDVNQSRLSIQNMDQSQLSIQDMDQSRLTCGGREHCATMKSHNHLTARLHSRASAEGEDTLY